MQDTAYDDLQRAHAAEYARRMPEQIERLAWSQERLQAERERGLRALLQIAKQGSAWYRNRLAHIDVSRATEDDLRSIPTMTKDDLMQNFDAILTVPDVARSIAETHLERLSGDAYLQGWYHVVASGGSSGRRGVFVYDWEGWLACALTQQRFRVRERARLGIGPDAVTAVIAGGKASHMSYAISRTFGRTVTTLPATLPIEVMVERLNAIQPVVLGGYPSIHFALAGEAFAGRLRIRPRLVVCASEPLLPDMRRRIKDVWSVKVMNGYFTSEGASASDCGFGEGMHLNEDICIFEPVDAAGNPVAIGQRAAKVYVTPLFNHAQPLIRYELTDEVTLHDGPCPCGCMMRRIADIEGRTDDLFVYPNGIVVHPMVFRSCLGQERSVVEYQVHQTKHGAAVSVRCDATCDLDGLRRSLERALHSSGLLAPKVTVEIVVGFDRGDIGKLKRFFPIAIY